MIRFSSSQHHSTVLQNGAHMKPVSDIDFFVGMFGSVALAIISSNEMKQMTSLAPIPCLAMVTCEARIAQHQGYFPPSWYFPPKSSPSHPSKESPAGQEAAPTQNLRATPPAPPVFQHLLFSSFLCWACLYSWPEFTLFFLDLTTCFSSWHVSELIYEIISFSNHSPVSSNMVPSYLLPCSDSCHSLKSRTYP